MPQLRGSTVAAATDENAADYRTLIERDPLEVVRSGQRRLLREGMIDARSKICDSRAHAYERHADQQRNRSSRCQGKLLLNEQGCVRSHLSAGAQGLVLTVVVERVELPVQ